MVKANPIPVRLKEARKLANMTQEKLGIRIGLDPSSASSRMNHYEKERHTPDVQTLQRMADELEVPLNYFFCDSVESAELACLISRLSTEDKHKLIEQLNK